MMIRITTAAVLSLWIPSVAYAGRTLTVGDAAPGIEVSHWLKGAPVEAFEPGKIYVLEFWATWCAPCRAAIPHLGELQRQYKDYDVTFLGVSDEKLSKVVEFLCKADSESVPWNDKMTYTVAADPDRSTHDSYMLPAAREGIPSAFIIGKDGHIEWIGNPHLGLDEALARVVRNDWDRSAFRAQYEQEMAPVRQRLAALEVVDAAVEAGDWDAAIAAVGAIEERPARAAQQLRLFRKMLKSPELAPRAFAYGRTLMNANAEDAGTLNGLAWYTAIAEGNDRIDLDFALEAAQQACKVTDYATPGILDTLARVHFERGEVGEAVKWQREAVAHATSEQEAADLGDTLAGYEKAAAGRS